MLLVFMVQLVFVTSNTLSVSSMHNNIYLKINIQGMRLSNIVGKRLNMYVVGTYDAHVLVDRIASFIGSSDPHGFVHMGSARAGGFLVDIYRCGNVRAYVSSHGFVRVIVGDGKSLPYLSYRMIDKNASSLRRFLEDLMGVHELRVIYAGISGEKSVTEIVETVYPNGTHVRNGPVARIINPFDKYYIVLGGLRIGYPVKIRGVDRDRVSGGAPRIQYLEFLAPKIVSSHSFMITRNMVDGIKEYFDSAFKTSINASSLIVIDAYLLLSSDKNKLLPTLKIQEAGTGNVLWVQLDVNKTIFISAATYASLDIGPDEPTVNIPSTITSNNNKLNNTMQIIALIIATIIGILIITLKRKKH